MSPRREARSAQSAASGQDLIGSNVGPYRVIARLGAGGMGEVYEVEHVELGRRFALKALRAELLGDSETLARFHREPRAVAKLVSEHVVSIVDCGALNDGVPYFVMERLYGSDLRRLLNQQGLLPVARVASLGVDACRGLACAHHDGLVHRDLKPENLFLTMRDDGSDLCKLLDFGVVKSARDSTTGPGTMLGTPRYMAPEQLGLDVPVSPQTDLFALGVILYECLAGHTPFEGDSVERVLFKIMAERETSIRELRPEVPAGLSELLTQALAKKPAERPSSALAFAEALLPYVHDAAPKRVFSKWQLQVAEAKDSGGNDAELTMRLGGAALERGASGVVQRRHAYRIAGGGAVVGLVSGSLLTAMLWHRSAEPPVSPPSLGAHSALPAPVAPPPSPVTSAEPQRVPDAAPTVSVSADVHPSAPVSRAPKSASAVGAGAAARSAPPAASFDPHNPYAP